MGFSIYWASHDNFFSGWNFPFQVYISFSTINTLFRWFPCLTFSASAALKWTVERAITIALVKSEVASPWKKRGKNLFQHKCTLSWWGKFRKYLYRDQLQHIPHYYWFIVSTNWTCELCRISSPYKLLEFYINPQEKKKRKKREHVQNTQKKGWNDGGEHSLIIYNHKNLTPHC